jgi:hypothetical protein
MNLLRQEVICNTMFSSNGASNSIDFLTPSSLVLQLTTRGQEKCYWLTLVLLVIAHNSFLFYSHCQLSIVNYQLLSPFRQLRLNIFILFLCDRVER